MTGATAVPPSRTTGRSAIRPRPSVTVVPPVEWNPSTALCDSEVTANEPMVADRVRSGRIRDRYAAPPTSSGRRRISLAPANSGSCSASPRV